MENIPRKLEKSVAATAAPQAPKRSNRWTILLVADSGKIISIPWIKPLGVVFTFVFLMAAGASIVLYFFFQQEVRINADLRDQLNGVHMEAAELRNEKEMLLARAVMAESRYQASLPAVETGEEDVVPDRVEMPQGAEATSLLPVEKKAEDAAGELSLIGVGEPSLSYDSTKKRVHVQIKIANQGIESQPVSGYVFVRLKSGQDSAAPTLVIPAIAATSQMSSKYNLGQYFSIARFVMMGFKAPYSGDPGIFKTISVYIFSTSGKMVLQKDLSVKLQTS